MSSTAAYPELACPPRFGTPRTPSRKTLGGAAAKVAALLGITLMPHQRHVLDVALELEGDQLAYRDVVLTVPRQAGKTTLLLVLWVTRCVLERDQRVTYSAQSGQDARKKWSEDWVPVLRASPLGPFVQIRLQNGSESVTFRNGSRQSLVASTVKSGHGSTIDLAILDEVFAYPDARVEQALRPATVTRPKASFWICSTAGTPHGSGYLLEKVERGRLAVEAGLTDSMAYFEWSAPEDADIADPDVWRAAQPAWGYTISEESVRASFESMAHREFSRGYLNRWQTSSGDPIVTIETWQALADPQAPRPPWAALGLDIAPRGKSASIVAVGERGDCLQAALLEHGPGAGWVMGALERLVTEYDRPYIVLDERACAALLPEIRDLVGSDKVIALTASDVPSACSFWLHLVTESKLFHRGEAELAVALDGASQRQLGDGWAWSRVKSGVDITPIVAMCWGVEFFRGSFNVLGGDDQ